MKARLVAVLLAAAAAAYGFDHEFDRVVGAVEQHYGVQRMHIPLMGLANFFVKVAHPAGTSDVRVAIFEDLPSVDDRADLENFMNGICAGRMHPMVVTSDRVKGESTYILTGDVGKSTQMLIATFDSHEAMVIEVTVNVDTLARMIASPDAVHTMFGDKPHDNGDGGR
jgi:hypothetical protein